MYHLGGHLSQMYTRVVPVGKQRLSEKMLSEWGPPTLPL